MPSSVDAPVEKRRAVRIFIPQTGTWGGKLQMWIERKISVRF